jgi:hypothetical protein
MSESPASQGRAKRIKLVGSDSVGCPPKEFSDDNDIAKMEYHIHNFANREEIRDEGFYTGSINAHGHLWRLLIYPRGDDQSSTDTEYISIYLNCAVGKSTKTNPVLAKAMIRTKTKNIHLSKGVYSKENFWGVRNYSSREDIIKNDCNDAGTLTITVELEVATEKKSVWYPQSAYYDRTGSQLFGSTKASDVVFIVGNRGKEFVGHKCILALRAEPLYELVIMDAVSSSKNNDDKNSDSSTRIELQDVDEKIFEILLEFAYTGKEPKLNDDEGTARSVLLVANRFGCTDLKLYAESVLVDKFLVPSNAAALLLFADSYSCALLKEATMNTYIKEPKAVIESKDDWTKLKESNDLLVAFVLFNIRTQKVFVRCR